MSRNGLYGSFKLTEGEGSAVLSDGTASYRLTDYIFDPGITVESQGGKCITLRNSFSLKELINASQTGGTVRLITGNEYDARGLYMLIVRAAGLPVESVDINYVEGLCFIDYLSEKGAVSEETAVSPAEAGISNPKIMNAFIHSKKVRITDDGRFYFIAME